MQRQPSQKPPSTIAGLPGPLKAGVEALSGVSMDHVRVHYNSTQPAQLNAHAYAQGGDIHIAPQQEKHLPHEAWHIVQQARRQVNPTATVGDSLVNDDAALEREADCMGERARQVGQAGALAHAPTRAELRASSAIAQRKIKIKDRDQQHGPKPRNEHFFQTDIENAIKDRGFNYTNKARKELHKLLSDQEKHIYDDFHALVNKIEEFCYRELTGPSMGPRTLGTRPTFYAAVTKAVGGKKEEGTAGRHIVSSSTLGRAIEKSNSTDQEIRGFLNKHHIYPSAGGRTNLLKRSAWIVAHNNIGNLFTGRADENTAIGFVRSEIQAFINVLLEKRTQIANNVSSSQTDGANAQGAAPDSAVGEIKRLIAKQSDEIQKPRGPMDEPAQKEWTNFTAILSQTVNIINKDNTVDTLLDHISETIELLTDFKDNADFDWPQENVTPKYNQDLMNIYRKMLEATEQETDIFEKNGLMDQFMALDWRNYKEQSADQTQQSADMDVD